MKWITSSYTCKSKCGRCNIVMWFSFLQFKITVMSSYPFNSSFTKQFRQEQPVTFCGEEKAYEQIVISTYNRMSDGEMNLVGSALNEQLFDNGIIHRLLAKLTQNDTQ